MNPRAAERGQLLGETCTLGAMDLGQGKTDYRIGVLLFSVSLTSNIFPFFLDYLMFLLIFPEIKSFFSLIFFVLAKCFVACKS